MHKTETIGDEVVIHLPRTSDELDQDAEWCEIETEDGRRRRIRFHDYADIFAIPGLYERLFYDELQCCSPTIVADLLAAVAAERGLPLAELSVLDVGAGNGMVGAELARAGIGRVVGVDILPEAAAATERDRPGVYDDYRVVDLTDLPPDDEAALTAAPFDCLVSVAALGFGDMPPLAFARAFDLVRDGGLVAFTIKERFTDAGADESGFSQLLRRLEEEQRLQPLREQRYRHRLSVTGEPLHYVATVAEKRGPATDVARRAAGGRFARGAA